MMCLIGGVLILSVAPSIFFTLPAAVITGYGISLVFNNFVTALDSHYGNQAPIAITQANAIGSCGYILGTAMVGAIATYYREYWRLSLIFILPLALLAFLIFDRKSVSTHIPDIQGRQQGKLSRNFWLAWFGFVACISSEFAISFWAGALIIQRTNSSPAISTLVIVALGTGMALGRWYWSDLLKKFALDIQLQVVILIQLIGFLILWTSHNIALSFFGLLVTGLGISSQFAFASLRLLSFSENRPDLAVGRSSLGVGFAAAGSPFLLGVIGDQVGISRAYLMVPVLIFFAFLFVKLAPSTINVKNEF